VYTPYDFGYDRTKFTDTSHDLRAFQSLPLLVFVLWNSLRCCEVGYKLRPKKPLIL